MTARRWLVVTGISGSGRTTALRALEDCGWYCVDNLPADVLIQLHESMERSHSATPIAVGIDIRSIGNMDGLDRSLDALRAVGASLSLLYLDCSDDVLIRRFAETRRKHPVQQADSIPDAIARERERMIAMRERTALVLDTSELNVHQLKARIADLFGDTNTAAQRMQIAVSSFGFKHGPPRDADWIFDARGLPNPHFVPELRPRSGTDPEVAEFVMGQAGGATLLSYLVGLLTYALPLHVQEGRALVSIAIGCTGGRHRSVALAEALAAVLEPMGHGRITVSHRDRDNLRRTL